MRITREQRYQMQYYLNKYEGLEKNLENNLEYFSAARLLIELGAAVIYEKFRYHKIENLDEIPETIVLKNFDTRYLPGAIKFLAILRHDFTIKLINNKEKINEKT